ncbi:MAG: 4Fe-4S dicluster domain-containing protein, partial [Desulfobacterales bacterium]|nr:4Fe-4S dicluster domain-containing protein [Desulfobacterales bacterium]
CNGCGICIDECPVEVITLNEMDKAQIDEESCIRCAKCHDVCPEEAVRHDSEKIPEQVDENLEKTRKLLEYYDNYAEQQAFIERMIRYFNKERKVTEFTIEKLKALKAGMSGSAASEP